MVLRSGLDIVVPMHNSTPFIRQCLESLNEDDHDDIRIIVVNDGSNDGCDEIVAREFDGKSNVILLNKENGGCASARNFGRAHSQSSHIAFVDADDFVDPGLFGTLYDFARQTNVAVVQSGYDFFDDNTEPPFRTSGEIKRYGLTDKEVFQGHPYSSVPGGRLLQHQPTIWRRVYRREFIDLRKAFFPAQFRAFDDQYFHFISLAYAAVVPTFMNLKYHYRQHLGQDIKQGDERHFNAITTMEMVLKRSIDENWQTFLPFSVAFINSVNWSLSLLREDLKPSFADQAANILAQIRHAHGFVNSEDQYIASVRYPGFIDAFLKKLDNPSALSKKF
jgi:glycosyltransferase involved in cell wall biosynthesis